MPRIELPSKQADGTPNYVDVRDDPNSFLAAELFAIHAATRLNSGADGNTSYSPREMDDSATCAFLAAAITSWSFPSPIPSQVNVATPVVVIGRAMSGKDYSVLRRKVRPLIDELEGADDEEESPKAGPSAP